MRFWSELTIASAVAFSISVAEWPGEGDNPSHGPGGTCADSCEIVSGDEPSRTDSLEILPGVWQEQYFFEVEFGDDCGPNDPECYKCSAFTDEVCAGETQEHWAWFWPPFEWTYCSEPCSTGQEESDNILFTRLEHMVAAGEYSALSRLLLESPVPQSLAWNGTAIQMLGCGEMVTAQVPLDSDEAEALGTAMQNFARASREK